MAEVQNIFSNGRMDSDTDYSMVDNKGFVYALNLRSSGYGKDGTLLPFKGSELIADHSENGTMRIIGMYAGENNKLYSFLARADQFSKIIETDIETRQSRVVIQDWYHLRFDLVLNKGRYLLSVNQVGDFLYFSNEEWKNPRYLDLTKDYTHFELNDIILNKMPPFSEPKVVGREFEKKSTGNTNNNKFVSFAYRYKYSDGSYSTLSFYSDVAFAPNSTTWHKIKQNRENEGMNNFYKRVDILVNSGDGKVVGFEVIAREHMTNNAYIIYSATKGKTKYKNSLIADNQDILISYSFSTNYPMLDGALVDLLYSNIPNYPKAQDFVGSRLFYANYKEGFDLVDINGDTIEIDYELKQKNDFKEITSSNIGGQAPLFRSRFVERSIASMLLYNIGIVYYNNFNEATTVLQNSNNELNEISIDFDNRLSVNSFLSKIKHTPPKDATKFKFVIKSQKLNYEIIYSTYTKKIGSRTYILLNGDNINRLKKDDTIIRIDEEAKEEREYKILEVKQYDVEDGLSKKGIYAYFESESDFEIEKNAQQDLDKKYDWGHHTIDDEMDSTGFERFVSYGSDYRENHSRYWNLGGVNKTDIKEIKEGDTVKIRINIRYEKYATGTDGGSNGDLGGVSFEKEMYASSNYSNPYDFFKNEFDILYFEVEENKLNNNEILFRTNSLYPDYLKRKGVLAYDWRPHIGGGWSGLNVLASMCTTDLTITRGNKPIIFRTKNKETQNTYFYESNKTYSIINGQHIGADSDGWFDVGFYNAFCWGNGVESYKIKDGFNAYQLDFRFRPNAVETNGYSQKHRKNDITYSGLYNRDLKLNNLNLFNPSTVNWKELPTEYGEIQRIISTDGDITTFCNDKVINVYYGKSIISDLQGNENIAMSNEVLGGTMVLPYKFGCQHPESISKSVDGIYFTDKKRTRYLFKSDRQILELNAEGSGHHYKGVNEIKTNDKFISCYYEGQGEWLAGLGNKGIVCLNPQAKGFSYYQDFEFDFIYAMNGKRFTAYKGKIYEDEVNTENYNVFAGGQGRDAKFIYVVNPEMSSDKVFKTQMLNSTIAWNTDIKTNLVATKFTQNAYAKKESFYFSPIYRDNSTSQNSRGIGEVQSIEGNKLHFSRDVDLEIACGDILRDETNMIHNEITDISDNIIEVQNATQYKVGDYVLATKQNVGGYNPDGVPMRGRYMEVTLTTNEHKYFQFTSSTTEIIESKF